MERITSPTDRTPGRVVEVNEFPFRSIRFQALMTTNISAPGDSGAPVVDSDGSIVAVVWGRTNPAQGEPAKTISIPIESVKMVFPQAF